LVNANSSCRAKIETCLKKDGPLNRKVENMTSEVILDALKGHPAHDGVSALVSWATGRYNNSTAHSIQINFHPDGATCHPHHHDRERPNYCGTVCFNLGSTRTFQCKYADGHIDNFNFKSGDVVFFNDLWNRRHTHAVPMCRRSIDNESPCGPRISICVFLSKIDVPRGPADRIALLKPIAKADLHDYDKPKAEEKCKAREAVLFSVRPKPQKSLSHKRQPSHLPAMNIPTKSQILAAVAGLNELQSNLNDKLQAMTKYRK